MRTTKLQLLRLIARVNEISKRKYALESNISGWHVVKLLNGVNTNDGIDDVNFYGTKSDTHDFLCGLLRYLEFEARK